MRNWLTGEVDTTSSPAFGDGDESEGCLRGENCFCLLRQCGIAGAHDYHSAKNRCSGCVEERRRIRIPAKFALQMLVKTEPHDEQCIPHAKPF